MRTLDLHGKTGDEVVDLLDNFILREARSGAKSCKVMTGKGRGIVQKIALDYLKRAGYGWHYELIKGKPNEGVLIVHL